MGGTQSQPPPHPAPAAFNSSPTRKDPTHGPSVDNHNPNVNHLYGPGTINNNNHNITNYVDARPPLSPAPHTSDSRATAVLPAEPIVFYGRDEFVNGAVNLLIGPSTARLAVMGSGGMGKTAVALTILYDKRIIHHFSDPRYFLSCEGHTDADSVIISLAKILSIPASSDLMAAVVSHLTNTPRAILVLDNLETVWLVKGRPVAAVDVLLGKLAQISSLSLIITCRGTVLPQSVKWSNVENTALESLSLDAALRTFQDKAGRHMNGMDVDIAKQLLDAVDKMPLAVSILGQLVGHGSPVSELLDRWTHEHINLLRTHGPDRLNSADVSIELSISMLCAADDSREALHLLSICSMLPDGLHLNVFKQLQSRFSNIYHAKDTLCALALVRIDSDKVLRVLSPVRHLVLERYPARQGDCDALHSIYFSIANGLPTTMSTDFEQLAKAAKPELGNLSAVLLSLVGKPSQEQTVDGVVKFTLFMCLQQPTLVLACALLPYLDTQPRWKAACLRAIGLTQYARGDYKWAVYALSLASQLYLEDGSRASAAECTRWIGEAFQLIGELDVAAEALDAARRTFIELDDVPEQARCRVSLGELMRKRRNYAAAITHFMKARPVFDSHNLSFEVAQCSEHLGRVYLNQGHLDSAATELEAARLVFTGLGSKERVVVCTCALASVCRRNGDIARAEELLDTAQMHIRDCDASLGLAVCAWEFGQLRRDQGRWKEAMVYFTSALELHEAMGVKDSARECRQEITKLKSAMRAVGDTNVMV